MVVSLPPCTLILHCSKSALITLLSNSPNDLLSALDGTQVSEACVNTGLNKCLIHQQFSFYGDQLCFQMFLESIKTSTCRMDTFFYLDVDVVFAIDL
jgi:hypothetical protein